MSSIVEKEYNYIINGKPVIIRRKWTVQTEPKIRNDELDQYIKEHEGDIKNAKSLRIKYEQYNNEHETKIKYDKLYSRCVKAIGHRYKQNI